MWWKASTGRIRDARRALVWRAVHWGWREFQRAGIVTAGHARRAGVPAVRPRLGHGVSRRVGLRRALDQVGDDTLIGALVTMSAGLVPGQDLGPDPVLRIGDRCVIGRGSHIVAHQSVEIGDDVWTGPYVYITDQNHGYADPGRARSAASSR